MSSNEIPEVTKLIKGLFPAATDQQIQLLHSDFANMSRDLIITAISRYGQLESQFSIPRLRAMFRELSPQRPAENYQLWRDRADADWKKVEATLAPLSEEDLLRYKMTVLQNVPPDAKAFLENCDPHSSPTLRAYIAEIVK